MKTRWYTLFLTLVILVVGAVFGVALGGLISSLQKGENLTMPEFNASTSTPLPTTTQPPTTTPPPRTTLPPTTQPPATTPLPTTPAPTTTPPPTTPAPTTTQPPTTPPPPTVPVNVTVLSRTTDADRNTDVFVTWNVSGGSPGDITATMILWSDTTPTGYAYKYNTTALSGKTPKRFNGNFTTDYVPNNLVETYHFRVYARVDGRDYYSPEYNLSVYGKKT